MSRSSILDYVTRLIEDYERATDNKEIRNSFERKEFLNRNKIVAEANKFLAEDFVTLKEAERFGYAEAVIRTNERLEQARNLAQENAGDEESIMRKNAQDGNAFFVQWKQEQNEKKVKAAALKALQEEAERTAEKESSERLSINQQEALERHALLDQATKEKFVLEHTVSKQAVSVGTDGRRSVKHAEPAPHVRTNLFNATIGTQTRKTAKQLRREHDLNPLQKKGRTTVTRAEDDARVALLAEFVNTPMPKTAQSASPVHSRSSSDSDFVNIEEVRTLQQDTVKPVVAPVAPAAGWFGLWSSKPTQQPPQTEQPAAKKGWFW